MLDLRRREKALAVVLAATAGFVDAVGFLEVGGYFVSFMSGNSTRMVVDLAEGDLGGAGIAAVVLVSSSARRRRLVTAGAISTTAGGARSRDVILLTALTQLVTPAAVWGAGGPGGGRAAAMGAMNRSSGEVSLGVTYMTGAVVRRHRLVDALFGGSWAPYRQQVALWSSLVCGGVLGAVLQVYVGVAVGWRRW